MAVGEHGTKAVIAAMAANGAIAIAKFIAFVVTGSSSLLAESIHSVADTGNQGLLLLGGKRSKQTADELHPFGYGRERYFWSFVVAIVLFLLGSIFALYEGAEKIRHPHEISSPLWAFGVLIFALIVEGLSFRTAIIEANKVRRRAGWIKFIRNAKSPELPVVLLEDSGAMAGLVIALAAVSTAHFTGEPIWDGIGTFTIGVLLGVIAIVLIVEMKSLLIGEAATRKDSESVRAAIEIEPAVRKLIHMRTQHQGPEELLVAAKVELDHALTFPEVAEVINRIERNVRLSVPIARIIYIEPDVTDSARATALVEDHSPSTNLPLEVLESRKTSPSDLGSGIPLEEGHNPSH